MENFTKMVYSKVTLIHTHMNVMIPSAYVFTEEVMFS